jgi:uncharacterized protein DUF1638
MTTPVLLIACGALAREIVELKRLHNWTHLKIQCLPAELHNTPARIPQAVRTEIEDQCDEFEHIFVAYADCGTGGLLDKVLAEYGVDRLSGAHCYEFFAGSTVFRQLAEAEMATFYLTDFLARHFDRLVRIGLGLDRHPELLPTYFGNYKRLVYLSQSVSPELAAMAERHAQYLGLEYQRIPTGLGDLAVEMSEKVIQWQN